MRTATVEARQATSGSATSWAARSPARSTASPGPRKLVDNPSELVGTFADVHPQPRDRHIVAKRVRDEIDLVTERGEGADAVVLAERRAARLEKRLGRNHEDAHVG